MNEDLRLADLREVESPVCVMPRGVTIELSRVQGTRESPGPPHPSFFIPHPSSFIIHHSSLILHPSSFR